MNSVRTSALVLALSCFTVTGFSADKTIVSGDPLTSSRSIPYHSGDVAEVSAQRGLATLIELPKGDQAVVPICADCRLVGKDNSAADTPGDWLVEAIPDSNLLSIAPLVIGAKTVVHVLASSGTVYSLQLVEISHVASAHADVRVRLTTEDQSLLAAINGKKRFVSADQDEAVKKQLAEAQQALEQQKKAAQKDAEHAKDEATAKVESSIHHVYKWDANSKAAAVFGIHAIYELNGFTVVEATPEEAPAIYETKDGKDSLIQFELQNGKYVIPKRVNDGYLKIGKSKLSFHREQNG